MNYEISLIFPVSCVDSVQAWLLLLQEGQREPLFFLLTGPFSSTSICLPLSITVTPWKQISNKNHIKTL